MTLLKKITWEMTPDIKSELVEYVDMARLGTSRKTDLLSIFMESSSDEENEVAQQPCTFIKQEPGTSSGPNYRPNGSKQDVDVDALTNVFSEMVISRHAILLANQWEPVRYEKGEALERIESCVANMLVSAYTSNDMNTTNLLKNASKFFKSKEEREDAHLVEDQLEQLMDRMVGWKLSEKTAPRVDDIGNMVAPNRPKYLPISRRIVRSAQIDEHSRIVTQLRPYINFLKQNHPHETRLIARLEAKELQKPLTEAEQKAKRKAFYEKEARQYMLNSGEQVDKSLVVFDYSILEKAEKKKAEEKLELSHQQQQLVEEPFEDVYMEDSQAPAVVRQPLRYSLKKGLSTPKPLTLPRVVPPDRKENEVLGRRQQLRQQLGDHLVKQHPSIYVEVQPMEEFVQNKKRKVPAKKQAAARKARRVVSPPGRSQQNNSVQRQRQYIRDWQRMASQQYEREQEDSDDGYAEDESDVEEVEQQQEYCRESYPEQEDFYEDEDEFGPLILPGSRLKSCLERKNRFSSSGVVRRIVFNENLKMEQYEIEEGCTMEYKAKFQTIRQTPPFVFEGRFTVDEETVSRTYKNLIILPHRDAPVPVMKRGHPSLNNKHSVIELKKEMYKCYKDVVNHIEQNPNRRVTRWLITDLLLSRLDRRILSNVVVTRIEYPLMPNWLIDNALDRKPELFPKEISYIFVACGFDFEMQYSRDDSTKPFLFLTRLHEWLEQNVRGKKTFYSKNVYLDNEKDGEVEVVSLKCSVYKRMPTIVAITIPEVGDYSGQFEQFNQRLRAHVEMLKERGGPNCTDFDLLDWAKLVNQSTDPDDTETVEDRTRLLMDHMANEYGILFNPITKETDEDGDNDEQ